MLRGPLAPGGPVVKQSAASPELLVHEGPALVFVLQEYTAAADDPDLEGRRRHRPGRPRHGSVRLSRHARSGQSATPPQAPGWPRSSERFLVCPSLHPAVPACGHRYGLVVLPGAGSATEIVAALEAGAAAVNLFPARAFTPDVLRDLLQAPPQTRVVPTGGIYAASAPEWITVGAVAVGMGGAFSSDADRGALRGVLASVDASRRPDGGTARTAGIRGRFSTGPRSRRLHRSRSNARQ